MTKRNRINVGEHELSEWEIKSGDYLLIQGREPGAGDPIFIFLEIKGENELRRASDHQQMKIYWKGRENIVVRYDSGIGFRESQRVGNKSLPGYVQIGKIGTYRAKAIARGGEEILNMLREGSCIEKFWRISFNAR